MSSFEFPDVGLALVGRSVNAALVGEELTVAEFLNCVLVANKKRSAYLLQPIDNRESSMNDPITSSKIQQIGERFPNLFACGTEWGIFFTVDEPLVAEELKTDADVGRILDFPCEYCVLDSGNRYGYHVLISSSIDQCKDQQLYAFTSEGDFHRELMEDRVRDMQVFFDDCDAVRGMDIKVSLKVEKDITVDECIQALLNGSVTLPQKVHIKDLIYNLFDSLKCVDIICSVEWENKTHLGILLTLMLYAKHDPMAPFYPLQYGDEQSDAVSERLEELANSVESMLNKTKQLLGRTRR